MPTPGNHFFEFDISVVKVSFDCTETNPLCFPSLRFEADALGDIFEILGMIRLFSTKCLPLSTWYVPQSGSFDLTGFQETCFFVLVGENLTVGALGLTTFVSAL